MQSAKFSEEKDVLRQIANASDAIRRKHRMLKLGKMTTEKAISEVFKPVVTPLEKLIDQSVKQELPIKKEENDDTYEPDRTFATAYGDSSEDELDTTVKHDLAVEDDFSYQHFLKMFDSTKQKKDLDTSYGVRKLQGNRLMIGDSPVTFDKDLIHIGDADYRQTEGLLELLFKKSPNESLVSSNDMDNYRRILNSTNAYRKNYSSENAIREDKSVKFKNIIAKMIDSPTKSARRTPKRRSQPAGKGLPLHMIARKRSKMDYVYWDDPNELVDRLRLLMASQAAGNTSHTNEIISIIEELREAEIVY